MPLLEPGPCVPALRDLGGMEAGADARGPLDRLASDDAGLDRAPDVGAGDGVGDLRLARGVDPDAAEAALQEGRGEPCGAGSRGRARSLLPLVPDRVEHVEPLQAGCFLEDEPAAGADGARDQDRVADRVERLERRGGPDEDGTEARRGQAARRAGGAESNRDDDRTVAVVPALLRLLAAGATPGDPPADPPVPVRRGPDELRAPDIGRVADLEESGELGLERWSAGRLRRLLLGRLGRFVGRLRRALGPDRPTSSASGSVPDSDGSGLVSVASSLASGFASAIYASLGWACSMR